MVVGSNLIYKHTKLYRDRISSFYLSNTNILSSIEFNQVNSYSEDLSKGFMWCQDLNLTFTDR